MTVVGLTRKTRAVSRIPLPLRAISTICCRSYWIPGAYAPLLSEKRHLFLRLLKNKALREERRTKNGVYAIGECTPLESNKSLMRNEVARFSHHRPRKYIPSQKLRRDIQ